MASTTNANGINNEGKIVGSYQDASGYHGFVYSNGKYTTLNVPLAPYTYAEDINDKGEIVGYGGAYGFLYSGGKYTTLSDPQGRFTQAYGINNKGQIVGEFLDSVGFRHGFLYSNGKYTTLDVPLAINGTFARGINNEGQIVGFYADKASAIHGFLYKGGKYTTLDVPSATGGTQPREINNEKRMRSLVSMRPLVLNTASSIAMGNIRRSMIHSGRVIALSLVSMTSAKSSASITTPAARMAFLQNVPNRLFEVRPKGRITKRRSGLQPKQKGKGK
jgi:probable HAF family extracellular repeat protein